MSEKYTDVALSPEKRAKLLLGEMTLEEKLAQINCVFPFGDDCYDYGNFAKRTIHGIGQVATLEARRMKTLEEVCAWQQRTQEIIMKNSPHHIPAVYHMEGLCGAFIQGAQSFPAGVGRGASFDAELEEMIARIVAKQEAACGITQVFAPVLDVARDPRMGRSGEPYSEDPVLCGALGTAYVRGVQHTEVDGLRPECVGKHFVGFHGGAGGIHGARCDITGRALLEIYAKPFQMAIRDASLRGIMPCYNCIDNEPAHASKALIQNLLRDEMGFDGVVISDYGGVANTHYALRTAETIGQAGLKCLSAGVDIEAADPCGYGDALKELFLSGEADISLLDRAALRVLTAKFRMGIFERPFALAGSALRAVFTAPEDQAVSLRSARESLILLKNDGVLPLRKPLRRVAVIGPHTDSPRKLFGGYTHMCMMESTFAVANSIAGVAGGENTTGSVVKTVPGTNVQSDETPELDEILARQKPGCPSLLAMLRDCMPETEFVHIYGYPVAGGCQDGFADALQAISDANLAILTLGGKHGACSLATMGEGVDSSDINLPLCQESFIREAAKLGKPLVGVHFDGRPLSSDAADECLNAILEAWSPAEAGARAVVEALSGVICPGGKLPVTVARSAGQLPMNYNHPNGSSWHQSGSIGFANYVDLPHAPRYPFGFGLSYTAFEYSDLTIDRESIAPLERVRVSCAIENRGGCTGCEIVQLYLRDTFASMVRPVKELAGFIRVTLAPGEKKRVTFTVHGTQTAYLNAYMRYFVERGEIIAEIGASSEDIRLQGAYRISADAFVPGRDRACRAHAVIR